MTSPSIYQIRPNCNIHSLMSPKARLFQKLKNTPTVNSSNDESENQPNSNSIQMTNQIGVNKIVEGSKKSPVKNLFIEFLSEYSKTNRGERHQSLPFNFGSLQPTTSTDTPISSAQKVPTMTTVESTDRISDRADEYFKDDGNITDTGQPSHTEAEGVPSIQYKNKQKTEDVATKKNHTSQHRLTCWSIKKLSKGNGIAVQGHRKGDPPQQFWHSTAIVNRHGNRKLSTASGSIYVLVGPIDSEECLEQGLTKPLISAFKNGFPPAWKELWQQHMQHSSEVSTATDPYVSNGNKISTGPNKQGGRNTDDITDSSLPSTIDALTGKGRSGGEKDEDNQTEVELNQDRNHIDVILEKVVIMPQKQNVNSNEQDMECMLFNRSNDFLCNSTVAGNGLSNIGDVLTDVAEDIVLSVNETSQKAQTNNTIKKERKSLSVSKGTKSQYSIPMTTPQNRAVKKTKGNSRTGSSLSLNETPDMYITPPLKRIKSESIQSSFLHRTPGEIVDLDKLPVTRSGRKIVPTLSWWTGQRILSSEKLDTCLIQGSKNSLHVIGPKIKVNKRKERIMNRELKKRTKPKMSRKRNIDSSSQHSQTEESDSQTDMTEDTAVKGYTDTTEATEDYLTCDSDTEASIRAYHTLMGGNLTEPGKDRSGHLLNNTSESLKSLSKVGNRKEKVDKKKFTPLQTRGMRLLKDKLNNVKGPIVISDTDTDCERNFAGSKRRQMNKRQTYEMELNDSNKLLHVKDSEKVDPSCGGPRTRSKSSTRKLSLQQKPNVTAFNKNKRNSLPVSKNMGKNNLKTKTKKETVKPVASNKTGNSDIDVNDDILTRSAVEGAESYPRRSSRRNKGKPGDIPVKNMEKDVHPNNKGSRSKSTVTGNNEREDATDDQETVKQRNVLGKKSKLKSSSKTSSSSDTDDRFKSRSQVASTFINDHQLFKIASTAKNSLVEEDVLLSVNDSDNSFDLRSDILCMLENRRNFRLSSKPEKTACYNSPHVNVENVVRSKNHGDKYYLKKALMKNAPEELRQKVANDSPFVQLEDVTKDKSRIKSTCKLKEIQNKEERNQNNTSKSPKVEAIEEKRHKTKHSHGKRKNTKDTVSVNYDIKNNGLGSTVVSKYSSNALKKSENIGKGQHTSWTIDEISRLNKAVLDVPSHVGDYWHLVATIVETRSPGECQTFYYKDIPNSAVKVKKSRKVSKPTVTHASDITGKAGTMKRKRQLREFMDNHERDHDDDLFSSTPYRGAKTIKISLDDNSDEEFFNYKGMMYQTPGAKERTPWAPVSEKKTPLPSFVSPGILKSVDRNEVDAYINRMKKSRRVFHTSNRGLPITGQSCRESHVQTKLTSATMNSALFTVQEVDDNVQDFDEDEDYYFSDEKSTC